MRGTRAVPVVILAALVLALLPGEVDAQEYKDKIYLYDDSESGIRPIKDVLILEETIDGVSFKNRAKRNETRKTGEVQSVAYGDAPPEWSEGLAEMARGDYEAAHKSFHGAITAVEVKGIRPWVKEHGAFYKARCRAEMAYKDAANPVKADTARDELEGFLGEFPASRLRPDALLELARILVLSDKAALARRQYTAIRDLQKSKELFIGYLYRANLGIARTFAMEKKWAQAIPEFESLELKSTADLRRAKTTAAKQILTEIRMTAASRRGDTLIRKAEGTGNGRDFKAARAYFGSLTGRLGRDVRVEAMAQIGEAICVFREGQARQGLRLLAVAKVRYFAQRDEVAKALYYMSKASEKLGYSAQAVIYLKELKEYYPDSDWARRAD